MQRSTEIFIGAGETPQFLDLGLANRHGLIAGATGTGKTVTVQILAEGFAANGVPVFVADVKGDLSGICQAGEEKPFLMERAKAIGLHDYGFRGFPTVFWDLFGEAGHPIRATVSEMGPLLLSRLLDLNDTQEGVLNVAFEVADDEGLLVLDLKDLRALLSFVAEQASSLTTEYGNVSPASVGTIQRRLLTLDREGAESFFGEPALDLHDMIRVDRDGFGQINVLAADKLIQSPRLYSTFLLWLLSELFEELPEVGDPERPKLVFFFDEAHLLFNDAPKPLLEKVSQVVRLIRSKGVGVYFATQNPGDVPDEVLGQLGNRIQHALRAYTPRDQKAITVAAETFRPNPRFSAAQVITELGVGEALVSTLQKKGVPGIVERTLIRPPSSRLGPATAAERGRVIAESPLRGRYDSAVDRESAHELLVRRAQAAAEAEREAEEAAERRARREAESRAYTRSPGRARSYRSGTSATRRRSNRQSVGEALAKSVARSIGSRLGREIVRGVLGSIFKGR
jgi:DNA helicase HerA-like ATPase